MFSRQKSRGKISTRDVQLLLLRTCWLFQMNTVLLYTSKLFSEPKKSQLDKYYGDFKGFASEGITSLVEAASQVPG